MREAEAFTELSLLAGIVIVTSEMGLLVKNKRDTDEHKDSSQ